MPEIEFSQRIISFLTFLPMFFISITVHEFAHAFVAYKYGDTTAKDMGRLTINPLKHIDLIGTVIMPVAAFASGFALIGWAKPVPINRNNFKDKLKDDALVTSAGPISNLLLGLLFFVLFFIAVSTNLKNSQLFINILWYGVFFNIFLCAFNLLPIPPLDGSHLLFDLFPNRLTAGLQRFGLYGSIILLLFIYSPLWGYFMKAINYILGVLLHVSGY